MRNNTLRTILLFTTLFTLFGFSNAYGQTCNSELLVSKNRDARSATENDSTQFQLELTNNSSKAQSYSIETSRYEGSFKVKGVSPATLTSSAQLDVSILQDSGIANSRITVPARSTVIFQARVSVPSGTPINKWGGIQVNAISDACEEGKVSTLLKLFVADSTEE
jgi:hypothetical protein